MTSLSEASGESKSAENTPPNHKIQMGFESTSGLQSQRWADHSPRADTSTSIEEEDGKDDNMVSQNILHGAH